MNHSVRKNVWVFHHYATPPTLHGLSRPYEFAKAMNHMGFDFTVFSSAVLHYSGINLISDSSLYQINKDTEVPFVFVRTKPYNSNGLDRVINMITFYRNIFKVTKEYLKVHQKPDVIIASSPHPLTMLAGIKIAKKLGIPCICEIRDFWPEVFFYGGRLAETGLLGKLLLKGEQWIYEKADRLIFLKEGDFNYLIEKKWDIDQGGRVNLNKVHYINNGVSIGEYDRQRNQFTFEDKDLISHKKNIIYTGAIRPVNNVENILETAKIMASQKDIQFLIYGNGSQLEYLQDRIKNENISNVIIKGYVEKKYIPYILSHSFINLLNYSTEKYNWSRGNSSNKLFEYLASGKPVISNVKMGYSLLERYNCGRELIDDTPRELANTIQDILRLDDDQYQLIGNNARETALKFDYSILGSTLKDVILGVLEDDDD